MGLAAYIREFRLQFFYTPEEREAKHLISKWGRLFTGTTKDKILVELLPDPAFLTRFLMFLKIFCQQHPNYQLVYALVDNFRGWPRHPIKRWIYFLKTSRWFHYKWISLYKKIGGKVDIDYFYHSRNQELLQKARQIASSLKSKEDLVQLKWNHIHIGDLIYDTYLRFKPAPTVDIQDPFLIDLIEWGLILHHRIADYLDCNSVKAVLTGYTSYLSHGVLSRLAMERGIPVYSMGAYNQLIVQPTKHFPYHKKNFWEYRKYFSQHPSSQTARAIAIEMLQKRLTGTLDATNYYMKRSAYADKDVSPGFPDQRRPRAVVMGHDFFDSPHIYGEMVFPDLFEWTEFIFSEASKSDNIFYYKPHPNAVPDNTKINEYLMKKYPHIHFLDKKINNAKLAQEGIDAAFTAYGTIAHEFAYLGIPVVTAADNPHSSFEFSRQAKSKEELRQYIFDFSKIKVDMDKSKIEEFFLVNNYRFHLKETEGFPFSMAMSEALPILEIGRAHV